MKNSDTATEKKQKTGGYNFSCKRKKYTKSTEKMSKTDAELRNIS